MSGSRNVCAAVMAGTDMSRRHLMHCLARWVATLAFDHQEAWLHKFSHTHSPELTQWIRKSANQYRARFPGLRAPKLATPYVKDRVAGQQGIENARRALL